LNAAPSALDTFVWPIHGLTAAAISMPRLRRFPSFKL